MADQPAVPNPGDPPDGAKQYLDNLFRQFSQETAGQIGALNDAIMQIAQAIQSLKTARPGPAAPPPAPVQAEAGADASMGQAAPAAAPAAQEVIPAGQAAAVSDVQGIIAAGLAKVLPVVIDKLFGGSPQPAAPQQVTLAQMEQLWLQKPLEMEFLANRHLPDPLTEYMPAESMKAYRSGWIAAERAIRAGKHAEPPEFPAEVVGARRRATQPTDTSTPTSLPSGVSNGSTAGPAAAGAPASVQAARGTRFAALAQTKRG